MSRRPPTSPLRRYLAPLRRALRSTRRVEGIRGVLGDMLVDGDLHTLGSAAAAVQHVERLLDVARVADHPLTGDTLGYVAGVAREALARDDVAAETLGLAT